MNTFDFYYKPPSNKKIWISADNHAFHTNYTRGVSRWTDTKSCRDFDNEVIMTEVMASNINKVIEPDDIYIHLGDWSFGGHQNIKRYRDMLCCKNIVYLFGNHNSGFDKHPEYHDLFIWAGHYLEFRHNGTLICCNHYSMRVWNQSHKGAIQLYGHSHGTLPDSGLRQMDVGIDTHPDFKPYLLNDVVNELRKRPVKMVDHHDQFTL